MPAPDNVEPQTVCTILFTDVVGYSKLMHKDEAATLAFLERHNQILRECIAGNGGRVIKTIGDAFMVVFDKAQAGMDCAVDIQNAMLAREPRYRIRAGLHQGLVAHKEGDVFGETVNIASRLESLSPPGGICVSASFLELCELRHGVSSAAQGLRRLKNIATPMAVQWIFPNRTIAREQRLLRLRLRSLRLLKQASVLAALALFIWQTMLWVPRAKILWEERSWKTSYTGNLTDVPSTLRDWTRPGDGELGTWPDGLLFQGYSHRYRREAEPELPFLIKIHFRAFNAEKDYGVVFIAASFIDNRETTSLQGRHPGPMAVYQSFSGKGCLDLGLWEDLSGPLNKPSRKGKRQYLGEGSDPAQEHVLTVRLDRDLLSSRLDDGKASQTLMRPGYRNPEHHYIYVLRGENVKVTRFEVRHRDEGANVDLAETADSFRRRGRLADAASLYQELIDVSKGSDDLSFYTYKRSLALEEAGNTSEAKRLRRGLADGASQDVYAQTLRFDAAEEEYLEGLSLFKAQPERARAKVKAALQRLGPFLLPGSSLPETAKAKLLALSCYTNVLKDTDAVLALAQQIFLDPENPYGVWALSQLGPYFKAQAGGLQTYQQFLLRLPPSQKERNTFDEMLDLEKLWVLGQLGQDADFAASFMSLAVFGIRDQDTNDDFYQAGHKQSWRVGVRSALKAWLEDPKNEALADPVCRAALRMTRISENEPIAVRRQFSPLSNLAVDYFAMHPAFKEDAPPAATVRILTLPDQLSFTSGGADKQLAGVPDGKGGVSLSYNSGRAWGAFIALKPKDQGHFDFHGYRALRMRLRLPQGTRYHLAFNEVGQGPPGGHHYNGASGSDGEQYITEDHRAAGGWEEVLILFSDFYPSLWWGNQLGNHRLDLQALEGIALHIGGKQGQGRLGLKSIELIP